MGIDRSLVDRFPFFADFPADSLEALLKGAHLQQVEKDSAIFGEGDDVQAFFFLVDGHVRAVRTTPDGGQVIARYISPGEVFGIAPAIGRSTYPASAIAVVDCTILSWPKSLWPEIAKAYPQFAAKTYQTVGNRLQETQQNVVDLMTSQVEHRIAQAVLRLTRQAGRKVEGDTTIDFPITHREIAELTGTTIYTVSRVFRSWEERGWIRSRRQTLTIKAPEQLAALVGADPARES
jgi:CRP-like cAMP-binding protein